MVPKKYLTLPDPDAIPSKQSMAQDLSDDSAEPLDHYLLFNEEFRLREIIRQLRQTASDSDKEKLLLHDLVEQLVAAMLRFLEMQSELSGKQMQRSSLDGLVEVRMKTAEFDAWEDAWGSEYRGDALNNLEKKLFSLSTNTPRTNSGAKESSSMSRLIPVVQASGAGKSRLADMYQTICLLS